MATSVTIAPGVKLWQYLDGWTALIYSLSDDNPGLHVRVSRDANDTEERISVKVVNPERIDDDLKGGVFTLAEFENSESGWIAAQGYALKMLDTFGWTELKNGIKSRIEARLLLTSAITPEMSA